MGSAHSLEHGAEAFVLESQNNKEFNVINVTHQVLDRLSGAGRKCEQVSETTDKHLWSDNIAKIDKFYQKQIMDLKDQCAANGDTDSDWTDFGSEDALPKQLVLCDEARRKTIECLNLNINESLRCDMEILEFNDCVAQCQRVIFTEQNNKAN